MKRFLVPLVLVIALAIPAQAAAGTRSYEGGVESGGTLSFEVKKKRKKKTSKVKRFEFGQVNIQCAAGPATTSGLLTDPMKVTKKGKFGVRATNEDGTSNLRVKGKLKQKGKKAGGTIRVFGETPLDDGTTGTACDTGKLKWAAKRT